MVWCCKKVALAPKCGFGRALDGSMLDIALHTWRGLPSLFITISVQHNLLCLDYGSLLRNRLLMSQRLASCILQYSYILEMGLQASIMDAFSADRACSWQAVNTPWAGSTAFLSVLISNINVKLAISSKVSWNHTRGADTVAWATHQQCFVLCNIKHRHLWFSHTSLQPERVAIREHSKANARVDCLSNTSALLRGE